MEWSKPFFGVQHLKQAPKGVQITVEDFRTIATCSIINFNRPEPFKNSTMQRFGSVAKAKKWGEQQAAKLAA